jgi:hypothetical protein
VQVLQNTDDLGIGPGCTNYGRQVAMETKFCTVAPNICGSSVWKLLPVTLLATRIIRWLVDFFSFKFTPGVRI